MRAALHFGLNEAKQVLLVHATGVVDMSVDLPQVVKVAMNNRC